MTLRSAAAVFGIAALAISPFPATLFPVLNFDVAHADNGKSKGNSGSKANNSSGSGNSANAHAAKASSSAANSSDDLADAADVSNGNGNLHSELKGLNAVVANPNALENASPNSQVGRIATYRDAALVTIEANGDLVDAEDALASLEVPARGIDAIDADIAALDPSAADYDAALATLAAERALAEAYAGAVEAVDLATDQLQAAAIAEHDALLSASGGREMSDDAIAYIRDVLNL